MTLSLAMMGAGVMVSSVTGGTYTMRLQFSGTTNSIKVVFAAKLTSGANPYYLPIFPCVTDFVADTS